MNFSTREDIDAPLETVYCAVTDFDGFERQLLRRGIDVTRDDTGPKDAAGSRWNAKLEWRGRVHDLEAELVTVEPAQGYAAELRSGGVVGLAVVDLVALSKARTRLFVSVDLNPTTFSSRIFVQTLKFARSRLTKRFASMVAGFARSIPSD